MPDESKISSPGAIAAFQSGASGLFGLLGQKRQHKYNMQLAQFQTDANERYLNQQLEYNTSKSQMARYKDAGLNPNLVYGQGNPGNQSAPLSAPEYRNVDYQKNIPQEMFQTYNQSRLIQAQVQATDANTVKTQAQSSLALLQANVLAKNPLLDPAGYNAIIDGLKATAESKGAQARIETGRAKILTSQSTRGKGNELVVQTNAAHKFDAELNLLDQKFNLGTADQKIKAEIINSKQFQNAILEVQKRFMTDADVTPQHILQFIQLLLMKML